MKRQFSHDERRFIQIFFAVIIVSAVLTYWITQDNHKITRELAVPAIRPAIAVPEGNSPVYCPICGEPIRRRDK